MAEFEIPYKQCSNMSQQAKIELPRVLNVQQFTAAREPEVRQDTHALVCSGNALPYQIQTRYTCAFAAAGPMGVTEGPGTAGWQQAAAQAIEEVSCSQATPSTLLLMQRLVKAFDGHVCCM